VVWAVVVVALVVGIAPVAVVQLVGQTKLSGSLDAVTPAPVVIVPGAGLTAGGGPSAYLQRRLAAALELYRGGTVRQILVSGDGRSRYHDEPTAMFTWLVAQGVPAGVVIRDGGGLDTYDTCVRAHQVYGIDQAIVVTQDYHVRRMVFSCQAAGIDVVGVGVSSASAAPLQQIGWALREVPASWKAFVDAAVRRPSARTGPLPTAPGR